MKLSEISIGMLIMHKGLVGFVAGITQNSSKEVNLIIEFQDGSKHGIHPANLEKVK